MINFNDGSDLEIFFLGMAKRFGILKVGFKESLTLPLQRKLLMKQRKSMKPLKKLVLTTIFVAL